MPQPELTTYEGCREIARANSLKECYPTDEAKKLSIAEDLALLESNETV